MNISDFSSNSKVWVYPINEILNSQQSDILDEKLREFVVGWQSHGAGIAAAYRILNNKFIVISADDNCTAASGCSIDTMRNFIADTLKSFNLEISNLANIYYLKDKEILEVSRPKFAELRSSGQIKDSDQVFDLTPNNLGDFLQNGICLAFKDSWHSKVFK